MVGRIVSGGVSRGLKVVGVTPNICGEPQGEAQVAAYEAMSKTNKDKNSRVTPTYA